MIESKIGQRYICKNSFGRHIAELFELKDNNIWICKVVLSGYWTSGTRILLHTPNFIWSYLSGQDKPE